MEGYSSSSNVMSAEHEGVVLPKPAVPAHLQIYVEHGKRPTKEILERPAKQQVEPGSVGQHCYTQGDEDFNIWYGVAPTDRMDFYNRRNREPAAGRCNPFTDSGWTEATLEEEKDTETKVWFCTFFAKGICTYGATCKYHHRVPTEEDDARMSPTIDIFGRMRHSSHREDMDGVGSFQLDCRNLFVGELTFSRTEPNYHQSMVNTLFKHFSLWGPLENVKVIPHKAIAFLRYKYRAAAEFAKVAMAEQNIGESGKQLCVRWAHGDRNPRAQEEIAMRDWKFTEAHVHRRMAELGLDKDTLLKYKDFKFDKKSGIAIDAIMKPAAPYSTGPQTLEEIEQSKDTENLMLEIAKEEEERQDILKTSLDRMNAVFESTKDLVGDDFDQFKVDI